MPVSAGSCLTLCWCGPWRRPAITAPFAPSLLPRFHEEPWSHRPPEDEVRAALAHRVSGARAALLAPVPPPAGAQPHLYRPGPAWALQHARPPAHLHDTLAPGAPRARAPWLRPSWLRPCRTRCWQRRSLRGTRRCRPCASRPPRGRRPGTRPWSRRKKTQRLLLLRCVPDPCSGSRSRARRRAGLQGWCRGRGVLQLAAWPALTVC